MSALRTSLPRTLGIALTVAWLLPSGIADSFSSFNFGEGGSSNGFGNFHAEQSLTPAQGTMQLYASALVNGGVEVFTRVGALYTLNEGELLLPFTAPTTAQVEALGKISCFDLIPGTQSSLDITLHKWRQEGTDWVPEESAFVANWTCPLADVAIFEQFTGIGHFTYEPGETYLLLVEALANVRAANGSEAIIDFCGSEAAQCGVIPGYILLKQISIPNQRPFTLATDTHVWYADAVVNRVKVEGAACDIDGLVSDIKVLVEGLGGETTTPINGICGTGQHFFLPLLPGTYISRVEASDDEGSKGTDVGLVVVSILPPLASAPVGFPELAAPTTSLRLEAGLGPDGRMESYRILSDGVLVADASAAAPPSHVAVIEYDALLARASVSLDGVERWSGPVAPSTTTTGGLDLQPMEGAVPQTSALIS